MREEPVLPRGAKVALALLLVAAVGAGAWALLGSGIDLPDLPDVNTGSSGEVTNLENTTLEETTLGEGEPADPFTSASFGDALGRVGDEAGKGAELTQVTVNDARTQFIVRRGNGIEAYSVLAGDGALVHENASITISGNATVADFAFPLAGVRASAIDRMLADSRMLSADPGFRPSVLSLERAIPEGSRALRWTINGRAGGRYVTYRADAEGGSVEAVGGGAQLPEQARRAQELNDCIQSAGQDSEKIFACLDRYR